MGSSPGLTADATVPSLLLLDLSTATCNPAQRPRCADTLPTVTKLPEDARSHGARVVYSTVPNRPARDAPEHQQNATRSPADRRRTHIMPSEIRGTVIDRD
jgi:nicotinamidase-related amidase